MADSPDYARDGIRETLEGLVLIDVESGEAQRKIEVWSRKSEFLPPEADLVAALSSPPKCPSAHVNNPDQARWLGAIQIAI